MILKEHLLSIRFLSPSFIRASLLIAIHLIQYYIESLWHKYCPVFARPVVKIDAGKLRGLSQRLSNGKPYHFFKGIPYAEPPVGELRFKPPVALERFGEPILDCSVHRSWCMQLTFPMNIVIGSEDGLFLNVYTPELPGDQVESMKRLPVMIYVHGGAFQEGAGDSFVYNPLPLLEEGVVVVTLNYRLGPLGFLCLPEAGIYGNMGLKDQRMAFRWVQQNISNFGGDPNNVTVFGASAGSTSVQMHYQSEQSRQYFHRVIGQSISGFTHPYFQVQSEEKAKKLAKLLGCKESSTQDCYETLMKASARRIVRLQNFVHNEAEKSQPYKFYFRPVVEVKHALDAIITDRPEDIVKRYDTMTMPIMTGGNTAEGSLTAFMLRGRMKEFDRHPERLISLLLDDAEIPDRVGLGKLIKQFYFGRRKIDKSSIQQLCDLSTDADFLIHQAVTAEWIARNQPRVKHYYYLFSFSGSSYFLPAISENSDEMKIKKSFIKLFSNFAKYDDPTAQGFEHSQLKWQPVKSCDQRSDGFDMDCLLIDKNLKMVRNLNRERVELWRGLFKKYKNGYLYEQGKSQLNC
ncbi:carboxylesterase [Culex quinquefasciatus]|uniref:Carboxylic ester hydrolase n=1 Tax=Culex quinquefasciatus TaxID=7176 RepID=B0VZ22_CULQU|nr:carboxylesterase [Culex quinquefasciatus]|eukprot:XP_001841716.1 carboxylesterase [Culex quinquefasciatus]